jgi:N-acetylglucosamine kinase-like BadF-type ATPase
LSYVIGVDGGATKTEAIVANRDGHAVGAGRSGCGNWEIVGEVSAAETIFASIQQALTRANIDLSQVRNAHMGLAGLDWPEDEQRLRGALERFLGKLPITLENDAFLGTRACAPHADGVAVSAGSGVCSSYIGPGGEKYLYGYFAELGGGFPIDTSALCAIIRAEDGRSPKTALTAAMLNATGHRSVADLLHAMTRESYTLAHTVVRPPVFRTAAEGDPVAVAIVREFGRELGLLATNLIRKYELAGTAPFVVASGSLFTRTGPLLFDAFRDVVKAADKSARVELSRRPPVAGAVRAALEGWGHEASSSNWEATSSAYEGALNASA